MSLCVQLENGDFRITELPLRKWTQDYKEHLDSLLKPEDKNAAPLVADYKCASAAGIVIALVAATLGSSACTHTHTHTCPLRWV